MNRAGRLDGIDFWRGFVLVCIFVNHIPGNVVGLITPRNFAFSDAAEAFVFLSGISAALAFGRHFASNAPIATGRILQRAGLLYVVHLALLAVGMRLYFAGWSLTGNPDFLLAEGREPILTGLRAAVPAVLTLAQQPDYYNILPLYVVLLGLLPGLLLLARIHPQVMLAASATVYAVTRVGGLVPPVWPEGNGWYFNPFAWQLLFAIGLSVGLRLRDGPVPFSPSLFTGAVTLSVLSALVVTNFFGLVPGVVDQAGEVLDWDKGQLGTVRLFSFLGLAYFVYHSNLTGVLRATSGYQPLARLGRHSLPVFFMATLASSLATILTESLAPSVALDLALAVGGTCILYATASVSEWQVNLRAASVRS